MIKTYSQELLHEVSVQAQKIIDICDHNVDDVPVWAILAPEGVRRHIRKLNLIMEAADAHINDKPETKNTTESQNVIRIKTYLY